MNKIVIIGFGAAGFYAAKSAAGAGRNEITIIEKRGYDMFSPCGLPFAVEGTVGFNDLKHVVPETGRLKKLMGHEVVSADTENKTLKVRDLRNKGIKTVGYDSLIIATGSRPIIPEQAKKFFGKDVFAVSNIENTKSLYEQAKKSRNAVVIGGGAIGLEVAMALKKLGLNVSVVEKMKHLLPNNLDEDTATIVEEYLKEKGVNVFLGKEAKIPGKENVEFVEIDDLKIDADVIIMSVGSKANIDFIKNTGIKTEKGIIVNEKMETNIKDVYAAGDCAETFYLINRETAVTRLATAAFRQGKIAGVNASGGDTKYDGSLGTFVSVIGEMEVASTGFNSETAKKFGYDVVTGKAKGKTKPEWMPNSKEAIVKIIADRSGRILGGQAIGDNARWRVNMVAFAIRNNLSVFELATTDIAYSPPVSELVDVLTMAAKFTGRRISSSR
ncbi:MAG: FAD-dependent oxidoreductase [Candidatus Thermoplasmatota archaeon]|nr:FAD-dependent oxidoreductase [Candidatus Thermoplasmatota archaeon]